MKTIVLMFFIIFIPKFCYGIDVSGLVTEQVKAVGLNDAVSEFGIDNSEILNELSEPKKLIESMVSGDEILDTGNVFKNIISYIFKELKLNMGLIIKVIVIAVFCGILKNLQDSFSGKASEIGFYVCFILMVSLLLVGFKDVLAIGKNAITNMIEFMQIIIPTLITLVASSGGVTAFASLYPTLLLFVQVISSVFNFVLLPLVSFYGVFCIISNFSNKKEFSKMAGFIKSIGVWVLGVVITVFVTVITAQSSIAGSIDGVAGKTAKFAFSSAVPIVGKALSDAVETVMGCSLVIKNTTGWVSIIIIFGIVLLPLIKVLVMIFYYRLTSMLTEPISDPRISNCLNDLATTLTWLFAIMITISFVFIISITILLKTVDISMMIR